MTPGLHIDRLKTLWKAGDRSPELRKLLYAAMSRSGELGAFRARFAAHEDFNVFWHWTHQDRALAPYRQGRPDWQTSQAIGPIDGDNRVFFVGGSYVPGSLDVFLNGILLRNGEDFLEISPEDGEFDMVETAAPQHGDAISATWETPPAAPMHLDIPRSTLEGPRRTMQARWDMEVSDDLAFPAGEEKSLAEVIQESFSAELVAAHKRVQKNVAFSRIPGHGPRLCHELMVLASKSARVDFLWAWTGADPFLCAEVYVVVTHNPLYGLADVGPSRSTWPIELQLIRVFCPSTQYPSVPEEKVVLEERVIRSPREWEGMRRALQFAASVHWRERRSAVRAGHEVRLLNALLGCGWPDYRKGCDDESKDNTEAKAPDVRLGAGDQDADARR